ncbi:hypothetical protein MH1LPH_22940 [Lactiplantibacillus brownii]
MCSVGEISRRSWLTNLAGQFKDVFYRLGIEASDRTLAGAAPHSTPILTDGALNLGESGYRYDNICDAFESFNL